MQSPLETEQVALDNMVIWTLKLCDQTSLLPYSTENRSIILANHNHYTLPNEPIRTQRKYMYQAPGAGNVSDKNTIGFGFILWFCEIVAQV